MQDTKIIMSLSNNFRRRTHLTILLLEKKHFLKMKITLIKVKSNKTEQELVLRKVNLTVISVFQHQIHQLKQPVH